MNWIKVTDQLPEVDQRVWYYFEYVGVWDGRYLGVCEDFRFYDEFPMTIFASKGGSLMGDVTHWMPIEASEKIPDEPTQEEIDEVNEGRK